MHLPRRCRRRLLLPPGWVALGFLLLLGCRLVQGQWRRLRPANVVSLSMPPLKTDYKKLAEVRKDSARDVYYGMWSNDYNPYLNPEDKQASLKIAQLRPWQTYYLADTSGYSLTKIEAAIRAIRADTTHAGGVRIRLTPQTPYAGLVALLDMMLRLNQNKYWLDIQHQPTTLYVLTCLPPTMQQRRHYKEIECQGGTSFRIVNYTAPPLSLSQQLQNLQQPERQPQLLLVGAVGFLLLTLLAGTQLLVRLVAR